MFKVSVAGSLMLFGEHAVLKGKTAIVAAVNARLQVALVANYNNKIIISSSIENIQLDLDNLEQELTKQLYNKSLVYVLECLKYINNKQKIVTGFKLNITDGNLKSAAGFGSSAAVVVGVLFVVNKFFSFDINNDIIYQEALSVVHQVQDGLGSGADVAASIYGGIIAHQNFIPQKFLAKEFDLIAIYCGYKTKTSEVIKIINNQIATNKNYKKISNYIFNSMDDCSKLAIDAIEQEDFNVIGKLMNLAHGLMSGLGIVDANLDRLATNLRSQPTIYGSKVSGAGLGDCVIGLGTLSPQNNIIFPEQSFMLTTTKQGVLWL